MTRRSGKDCVYAMAIAVALVASSLPAMAQNAAADPWTRVPAAPTGCYASDGFEQRVYTLKDALTMEIQKQGDINTKIKTQFDSMDMREKMSRMQAWMMKNPQDAQKMMQMMQTSGTTTIAQVNAANKASPKLDQDFKTNEANFRAAVDAAVKPIEANMKTFFDAKSKLAEGGSYLLPADRVPYNAMVHQANAAYEKVCTSFFVGPTAPFPAWLASYKTHVVNDVIAPAETVDATTVSQMAIMDSPAGGFRSTAKLEGVQDYLRVLVQAYGLRHAGPTKDQ